MPQIELMTESRHGLRSPADNTSQVRTTCIALF